MFSKKYWEELRKNPELYEKRLAPIRSYWNDPKNHEAQSEKMRAAWERRKADGSFKHYTLGRPREEVDALVRESLDLGHSVEMTAKVLGCNESMAYKLRARVNALRS